MERANETALPSTGVRTEFLGMWLFLASEVMFFAALIGGYIVLRLGSGTWPDPATILDTPLLAVNTFVLICSSVTMVKAVQAAEGGDAGRASAFLLATALLGTTFLGIKIFDYTHLIHAGTTPPSGLFGGVYFVLTGFHGAHVLGGVVALSAILQAVLRGRIGRDRAAVVECVGLYWHFVDIVWIVLFASLCLV